MHSIAASDSIAAGDWVVTNPNVLTGWDIKKVDCSSNPGTALTLVTWAGRPGADWASRVWAGERAARTIRRDSDLTGVGASSASAGSLWALGGGRDEFTHYRGGWLAVTAGPGVAPLPRLPAPRAASAPALVTKFLVPDVIFGVGVLAQVGEVVQRHGGVRVFVVSDQGVADAGWTAEVLGHLADAGVSAELWLDVTPNPKDTEVESGCEAYLASRCDVLVAVGGGSCIDAAKAIAVLAAGGGRIADYAGVGTVTGPLPPTVMVPTTGGSGSDVSQFCVVTDTGRKTKVTIGARALVPDISVTDPQVLTTVPADITAYTALDVLSHGIESYLSKAANFLSDVQALAAIRGVCEHLFPALDHPGDVQAREGLARASLQAGLAFTNALLGATHAISHQIGGLTDLPHGLLNAIMLPHVMDYNAPVATERLADVAVAMGVDTGLMRPCEAADAATAMVRALVGKASLPASLREIGVRMPQIDEIARNALDDAYIVTNPRPVLEEDARAICLAAW